MKIQTYEPKADWKNGDLLIEGKILDKEEAHSNGLLHKSAHLLLFDKNRGLYSRRRSASDMRYADMFTTTIGTHVDLGSSYLETLVDFERKVGTLKMNFLGEFRVQDDFENEVCGLYVAFLNRPEEIISNNHFFLSDSNVRYYDAKNKTTPHLSKAYELYCEKK